MDPIVIVLLKLI